MRSVFFAFIAAAAASAAIGAPVSMRLHADRTSIYLGESIVVSVAVEGSRDASPQPAFPSIQSADVTFLGSADRSSRSITVVNGKFSERVFEGRTFQYEIRPSKSGTFSTGPVVLDLPASKGGRVTCPGATVTVNGLEPRDDIEARIECAEKAILPDSKFRIDVSVSIRQLPEPNGKVEPIWRSSPLHMEADFLDFRETRGLALPDPEGSFLKFAGGDARGRPGFTVNSYTTGGGFGFSLFDSPFDRKPAVFRFDTKAEDRGGTNWWNYSFGLDYTALAEGDYTFGPITVKGQIVTGALPGGDPKMETVFVVAPAITIRVIPPPEEGRPDWFCGSVGRSLIAKAYLDATKCKVGDPLTLSLEVTGEISAASVRPPVLNLQKGLSDNFRIYDDSIESESIPGGKRFKYRLRPLKPGTLEFPPVKIAYYDTLKPGYVTVATDPLPVKVEETTQIATGLVEENDDNGITANAVVFAADGGTVARLPFGLSFDLAKVSAARHAAIWLLPALWLLAVVVRGCAAALRRHAERTRYGRIAAAALRDFRAAGRLASRSPAEAAPRAVAAMRAFSAAMLSSDNRSLTASEIAEILSRRGVDRPTAERFSKAFAAVEEIPYRMRGDDGAAGVAKEGEPAAGVAEAISEMEPLLMQMPAMLSLAGVAGGDTWRTMASALAIILIPACAARAEIFGRTPARFDWERAQDSIATAQSPDDFSRAADEYYAMVRDGAATGPLFHNLGTALLLAGRHRAAAEALDAAARWRGMDSATAGNRMLAEKAISGAEQLPPERYFFIWHYGIPLNTRAAFALLFWNLAWGALLVAAMLPKQASLRRGARAVAAVSSLGFVLFGASVAVSFIQIRSTRSIAALDGAAAVQEQAAEQEALQ